MDDKIKEFIKQVREAQRLAQIEQIKANAIVINTKFVKIPKLFTVAGGSVSVLPPMICGLEMHFTDNELPENYFFAITDCGQTERDRLVEMTSRQTAREIIVELNRLKNIVRENYGVSEQAGVDMAINRIETYIKEKGVEVE